MNDQVAIITGAASGIGRHFATELRRRRPQMRLVLADVNEQALAEAFPAGETVVLEAFDIRSAESWQRVVDETLERTWPLAAQGTSSTWHRSPGSPRRPGRRSTRRRSSGCEGSRSAQPSSFDSMGCM
jgi:nucleoside-diphosphate-sugar epimerase